MKATTTELIQPTTENGKKSLTKWVEKKLFSPKGYRIWAIAFACICYYSIVQIIDPDILIINPPSKTGYMFFSGNKLGVYDNIGNAIIKKDKNNYIFTSSPHFLHDTTTITAGSEENKNRISSVDKAFSCVYEDALIENKNNLVPIQELYDGRLHILYRRVSNKYGKNNYLPKTLVFSNNPDSRVMYLFNNAIFSVGQSGSIGDIFSQYIFKHIRMGKDSIKRIQKLKFDTALTEINNDTIQVLFFMSGVSDTFKHLLDKPEFGLIGLDDNFMMTLKKESELKINFIGFKGIYSDSVSEVRTISTKNYLVASQGTPYADKEKILILLDSVKKNILAIKDAQFLEIFKSQNRIYQWHFKWSFFLLFFTCFYIMWYYIITSFFSNRVRGKYFNQINEKSSKKIPRKIKLEQNQNSYPYPIIEDNGQIDIIKNICNGVHDLFEIRSEISTAYDNYVLTTKHYNFLMEKANTILDSLRKHLALRLHEVLQRDQSTTTEHPIDEEKLRKYLTADYIYTIDYERLTSIISKRKKLNSNQLQQLVNEQRYQIVITILKNYLSDMRKDSEGSFMEKEYNKYGRAIISINGEFTEITKNTQGPVNYSLQIENIKNQLRNFIDTLKNESVIE
jgi:hypothetical protein